MSNQSKHEGNKNKQEIRDSSNVNKGNKGINFISEENLKKLQDELIGREQMLKEKELELSKKELELKNEFPKLFEEKFGDIINKLNEREQKVTDAWKEIEIEKMKLRERELAIQKAEIERNNGYQDERKKLDKILSQKRLEIEQELSNYRQTELKSLETLFSQEKEARLTAFDEYLKKTKAHQEKKIQIEREELLSLQKKLTEKQAELDEMENDIEYQKMRLQSRKEALDEREENLSIEVENKVSELKQSYAKEESRLKDELERLRDSLKSSNDLISNFEDLKRKLGDEDPATILLNLKTYEEEIKNLREDLATRPTQEMQKTFDRLIKEKDSLEQINDKISEENVRLKRNAQKQSQFELKISELETENKSYKQRFESVNADNNRLMEELKRLQASYEREQDREARIRDIETPYIKKELPRAKMPDKNEQAHYELEWLDRISEACINYGLKFPRRILHAFHTALKTSEWSPITVLAGVSGTGKSELPRLYSHFGGINFLSLSVQPNWDSQESMLGFFNSIDNKFDAQPVLQLLAQSQKAKSEEYPFGLKDVMTLILLDEMNLAHVELYFAEFLSKLELRRGLKGNDVPSLEVKLGAGIQHYDLPLGRNVLWAGTMNQDETTKSLSDKVLDRGIIINFPRPTILERRRELKPLGEQAPLISRELWQNWWCRESKFSDEQILPFKRFIEEMNSSLSKVGRALGHRVWQSIEYYLSNYPDVLEAQRNNDETELTKAMKVAFEDQLVQKVMPKLRGIETRGKSKTECLDKIRKQLVDENYSIVEDFDLAQEFGYGQFIWNSANYLKSDESTYGEENVSSESEFDHNQTVNATSSKQKPEKWKKNKKNKSK